MSVNLIRFAYVTAGSALAAGAGAYLTLAFVPSWSDGVVAGRGWIAVALVIFAGYRPIAAVLSGLLFGLITAIGFVGQARGWPIAPAFLSMLPYLARWPSSSCQCWHGSACAASWRRLPPLGCPIIAMSAKVDRPTRQRSHP
nr:hypothetical protein [Rhizobium sp. P44RR-XXIV]